jgi:hypothetical protein
MTDPLTPSIQILISLGSIAVHVEEYLSPGGHPVDLETIKSLLSDPNLQDWIKDMGVYLPLKRDQ